MDALVMNVLTRRLDELEQLISPLEKEYKKIVEHIQGEQKVNIRTCKFCGQEAEPQFFMAKDICKKCYYAANKKPKKEETKVKTKTLAEINKEAEALGMSYGQYQAMLMMRGKDERSI